MSLLLAPLCPFVADTMWRALTGAGADESVHLADWPAAGRRARSTATLEAQMALARRLTSLGRAARSEAGVKVRQPLARALVFLPADAPEILRDIVADELNVDEIDTADELSEVLQFELVPNFRTLGPRLGERVKEVKPALAALDGAAAAAGARSGASHHRDARGEAVELSPDDVQLRVRGQQGFAVSREGGEVVALDLTLDDGLRKRGWPARSCGWCRTCARRAGWRCPTASGCTSGPRRRRRALRLHRPRGAGHRDRRRARGEWHEGTVLELDDEVCSRSPCGSGMREGRRATARADSGGVEHLARARRTSAARSVASRWATGGGRCPRCAAATARSRTARPSGVSTTWTLRRSFGQFCRATSPASTMRSTSRVTPPVVSATSVLRRLMVRRPSGRRRRG